MALDGKRNRNETASSEKNEAESLDSAPFPLFTNCPRERTNKFSTQGFCLALSGVGLGKNGFRRGYLTTGKACEDSAAMTLFRPNAWAAPLIVALLLEHLRRHKGTTG